MSATGQIALSHKWAELLEAKGLTAAQILVTLDDLEHRRRYLNASATLERLLGLGVVPVVNENDSVATAEIRFGDNDRLARALHRRRMPMPLSCCPTSMASIPPTRINIP